MPEPETTQTVAYDPKVSAGKATRQTLVSIGALLGSVALVAISDPAVLAQVTVLVKEHPQLGPLFVVVMAAVAFFRDRAAHRGAGGALVTKTPVLVETPIQVPTVDVPTVLQDGGLVPERIDPLKALREAARLLHGDRKTCPDAACKCVLPKRQPSKPHRLPAPEAPTEP